MTNEVKAGGEMEFYEIILKPTPETTWKGVVTWQDVKDSIEYLNFFFDDEIIERIYDEKNILA